MKCLIADDEPNACENLASLLKTYFPSFQILPFAHNTQQAENLILLHQPNLVFLDISMPKESGLEFVQRIETLNFEYIFVTAYNEFAVKAFKLNAIDYLLKPIDIDELISAVKLAVIKIKDVRPLDQKQIQTVLHNIRTKTETNHIVIPYSGGAHLVLIENIMYIEADGNYCTLFCSDKESILVTKQLHFFENVLNPNQFFRIHHSYILNSKYAKTIVHQPIPKILLLDGSFLPISRRKKNTIFHSFEGLSNEN